MIEYKKLYPKRHNVYKINLYYIFLEPVLKMFHTVKVKIMLVKIINIMNFNSHI